MEDISKSSYDNDLSYENWLFNQASSIYDILSSNLQNCNANGFLEKEDIDQFNLPFYFRSRDLNNSEDEPLLNRPKTAYEIGVKFEF